MAARKHSGRKIRLIKKQKQASAVPAHDYLNPKNFEIIPCLLFPSQKNSRSAQFLNLDWSNYEDNFSSFVLEIESITGDVLLTSPNDFMRYFLQLLGQLL